MGRDTIRTTIAVFDTAERAERAVAELLADGCPPDQVELIAGRTPAEVAAALAAAAPAERASYYAGEAASGRPLVVVYQAADDAQNVMTTLARYGGSVCVPPEVRDGRA